MFFCGNPSQADPQQRSGREIKRLLCLGVGQPQRFRPSLCFRQVSEIVDPQRECERRNDRLHGRIISRDENRAQDLMTPDHLSEAPAQHINVEPAREFKRDGDVISRVARFELVQKPKALLGERKWRLLCHRPARNTARQCGDYLRLSQTERKQLALLRTESRNTFG